MPERQLRIEEIDLIRALLSRISGGEELERTLPQCVVNDMNDGGMGSIRFISRQPRVMGKQLVETGYMDSDGVPVSIALNVDMDGALFELDFWKVDFSPLKVYPKPRDLAPKVL
jgi:hypothetical protein